MKQCMEIQCKYYVHVYVNEKLIPVETITGIWGGRMKENGGRGEFKYDRFDTSQEPCKCKYYNVPPPSTTIKEEKTENSFF
jgi:hypothetical protein